MNEVIFDSKIHFLFKERTKQMILDFILDACESDDTEIYIDQFNGKEKEFIDKWVEDHFYRNEI